MARQRKTLPARRRNAMDDSLLIRSAESLGRVIGSLQRQLDAARQLASLQPGAKAPAVARSASATTRRSSGRGGDTTGVEQRRNGQAPVRARDVTMKSATKKKSVAARKQSSTKRAPSKRR